MYILFFCLPIFILGQNVEIYIQESEDIDKQYLVYEEDEIQEMFLPEKLNIGVSCKPIRSFGVSSKSDITGFSNQTLTIKNQDNLEYNVLINQTTEKKTNIILLTEVLSDDDSLKPDNQIQIRLMQICPQKEDLKSDNYWTPIKIKVDLKEMNSENHKFIEFAFIFTCDRAFRELTFDWSLPILLIVSTSVVAYLAKYTRILSFRWKRKGQEFQGFEINCFVIMIYVLSYAGGGILVLTLDYSEYISFFFIMIACTIGILAVFFVTSELTCLFRANSIIRRYKLVVSSIVSLSIGIPYYLFKPWYLSDIISIAFIFLIVKFFRFRNFKTAFILMIFNILLDSTFAIIIHYTSDESYNTSVLQYLNCPLELQLPLIRLQYNKNCAWISLFSQAIASLFLSLAYRIDKSKRTFTYGLSGFLSLILAQGIWVSTTASIKHSIPETSFTYPILFITLTINSLRRAEFKSFFVSDYQIDQSYYRLRGVSLEDYRAPGLLLNMESIPDLKDRTQD